MLSESIEKAINDQINYELGSAYIYLSMSAYFERLSLRGFAKWARLQSQEEVTHGLRLFDYLNDRGGRVRLQAVAKPPEDYASPLAVFEAALAQEREVTKLIHRLYEFVTTERDYATQVALEWFIIEQVEEEKVGQEVIDQLRWIGDDKPGLLMLDRELGQRQTEADGARNETV
jgi:ferritin